eukprot:2476195-Pleurochrysis_carterae.AAC.2
MKRGRGTRRRGRKRGGGARVEERQTESKDELKGVTRRGKENGRRGKQGGMEGYGRVWKGMEG